VSKLAPKLVVALAAGALSAWAVAACGSGAAAVSNEAQSAGVSVTTTITRAAPTVTVVPTTTVAPQTTSVNRATTVQLAPATTAVQQPATETSVEQADEGVPWWAWVLIGLGVVAICIGIVALRHGRHGKDAQETT
jgi:hypothetical protein